MKKDAGIIFALGCTVVFLTVACAVIDHKYWDLRKDFDNLKEQVKECPDSYIDVNELKVSDVLYNPETQQYVQVKEITYSNQVYGKYFSTPQYFVTSGESKYISDAKTNIVRQVFYWTEIQKLKKVKRE